MNKTTIPSTPETLPQPSTGEGFGASDCYAFEYVPQWQEKIGRKLYPSSYTEIPEIMGMQDCLVCCVTAHLSWLDRLRLLISGKLEVTAKTATQNVIGNTFTATGICVRPPAWLDRHNPKSTYDA